jgi:hypothetical protein
MFEFISGRLKLLTKYEVKTAVCVHYRGQYGQLDQAATGVGRVALALPSPPLAFVMDRPRRYIGVPLHSVRAGSLASRRGGPGLDLFHAPCVSPDYRTSVLGAWD